MNKAESVEQIREHLARGGMVVNEVGDRAIRTLETSVRVLSKQECEWNLPFENYHWELLPLEEETPEERREWIEKAERDFPMDFEELWKWARVRQYAPQLLETLKRLTETSMETYTAQHKPEDQWDEYDYMMIPQWKVAIELIKEIENYVP